MHYIKNKDDSIQIDINTFSSFNLSCILFGQVVSSDRGELHI